MVVSRAAAWFGVPRAQLILEEGRSELTRYQSSDHGARPFCRRCGSSLFCESTHHPDQVDIVLANMDGSIDRLPQVHIYFDDRADWVVVDDGLPRLGGVTGLERTEKEPSAAIQLSRREFGEENCPTPR